MRKKINWFVLISIITITIVVLATPWLIHIYAPRTTSEITADGILGYVVGALSFASTLILSALALWQTHTIQKENDKSQEKMEEITKQANAISLRMLALEENNYKIKLRPFVNISSYSIQYYGESDLSDNGLWIEINGKLVDCVGKYPGLSLSLVNTTDSILTISYDGAQSNDIVWSNAQLNPKCRKLTLLPAESNQITFFAREEFLCSMFGKRVRLSFILENRFSQKYKESFDLVVIQIDRPKKKWHYIFDFQNFNLTRLENNENGQLIEVEEKI